MSLGDLHDNIGRIVGERYKLVRPIGRGASSQVYLAQDKTLDRQVAVKLLHAGLAGDERFLQRFRTEARRSAELSHQNIVTVYDWNDKDRPYIVTEYLAGGSLRAMIDAGNHLTPAQALVVGLGAAKGLEYAAKRGIVHRDIKPANLLFDGDGQVRIADFGLAFALSEAGMTQQDGELLGTVRYASPEQARGASLTQKSDVYSLGLSIIEAVTGEVPFGDADTSLGTLMARTESNVVVPDELGRLQVTVSRAGLLDADERPSAAELKVGFLAAAEAMAPPAKLPLVGTQAPIGATTERLAPTQIGTPGLVDLRKPDTTNMTVNANQTGLSPLDLDEPDGPKRKWPWVLFALVAVGSAIGGGIFAYLQSQPASFRVPALVGTSEATALRNIEGNGWILERLLLRDDLIAIDDIISTDPPEGTMLEEGQPFTYTVSLGPTTVSVPSSLVGERGEFVIEEIRAIGLDVEEESDYDEVVAPGAVIAILGETVDVPKGSEVTVVVSLGPEPREMPGGLIGSPIAEVSETLQALGLNPVVTSEFNEEIERGIVLRMSPREGRTGIERGEQVDLVVSGGPAPREVPYVIDLSVDSATAALEVEGFCVERVEGPSDGVVIGQDPTPDSIEDVGTCVTLFTIDPNAPDEPADGADDNNGTDENTPG